MPILRAHNEPQFTEHLGSVLTEANDQFHSVNIAVVYSTSPAPLRSVKGVDKTCQWGGAKVYQQRGHWPA